MKADLRYAEDAVNHDDARLTGLGWGGRASGTALQVPGSPRTLGPRARAKAGSFGIGRPRPTAAQSPPTRSSEGNARRATG